MSIMIWIWLGAVILFGAVEAVTVGLVSVWFVIGAAAALLGAVLQAAIWLQITLFIAVSAVALAATRPMVRKLNRGGAAQRTNADRVLEQEAKVTETVDNENASGAVYVDGKTWSARSVSGAVLPKDTFVRVKRIEGVKLYVEPIEKKEEL